MTLKQKLTTSLATGAIVLGSFVTPAFASHNDHITRNGLHSDNNFSLRSSFRTNVEQHNNADFNNVIRVNSRSGGNRANDTTDGNVDIDTGDIGTSINISNMANMNHAMLGRMNDMMGSDWDWKNGSIHNSMKNLRASLTGNEEVPGPGDQDGNGTAHIKIDTGNGKVCSVLRSNHLSTPTAAHIHKGMMGVKGPVAIALPTPDENGYSQGCMDVDKNLLMEIKDHPSEYYVNIHTTEYPDGALRGQLSD